MNLIPILTGDIRPTDTDGVHTPLVMYFEGHPIRFIIRPNLPIELMVAWVLTDVATALGFKSPKRAGWNRLTEGVDKGCNLIATLGGPQELRVLTYTGLTKLLMRSDKETARRFQDWLAAKSSDLTFYGVAFRDQSAAEVTGQGITEAMLEEVLGRHLKPTHKWMADLQVQVDDLRATLGRQAVWDKKPEPPGPGISREDIVQIVAAILAAQAAQPQYAVRSDRPGLLDKANLVRRTREEDAKKRREGYTTSREFLLKETGCVQSSNKASGFTRKVLRVCRERSIPCYPHQNGWWIPEMLAKAIYRGVEAQGDLFGKAGE